MALSWKGMNLRALAAGFRQRDLAVASVASFALMLVAGSAVLSSAGLHRFTITPSKTYINARPAAPAVKDDSPWGAAPDSRLDGQATTQPGAPLTSASYTSGFDKSAAGLGPLPTPPKQPTQTDARACPDNLNCAFRPAKAGAVALVAPPRKVTIEPPSKPAEPQPNNNFAFLTANLHWPPELPLANNILKPFSYVGDRVTDFVKKL